MTFFEEHVENFIKHHHDFCKKHGEITFEIHQISDCIKSEKYLLTADKIIYIFQQLKNRFDSVDFNKNGFIRLKVNKLNKPSQTLKCVNAVDTLPIILWFESIAHKVVQIQVHTDPAFSRIVYCRNSDNKYHIIDINSGDWLIFTNYEINVMSDSDFNKKYDNPL